MKVISQVEHHHPITIRDLEGILRLDKLHARFWAIGSHLHNAVRLRDPLLAERREP